MQQTTIILLAWLFAAPAIGQEISYGRVPSGSVQLHQNRQGNVLVVAGPPEKRQVLMTGAEGEMKVIYQGPLVNLAVAPDGDAWMVRGQRVLRAPGGNFKHKLVDHSKAMGVTSKLHGVFVGRDGTVRVPGCKSKLLANGQSRREVLASKRSMIQPVGDDSYGNVWAVARQGSTIVDLMVLDALQPTAWRPQGLPPIVRQMKFGPVIDDVGGVWFATENKIVRVDPQAEAPGYDVFDSPVEDSPISAIARLADDQICVGYIGGQVMQAHKQRGKPIRWTKLKKANGHVRAILHGRRGWLWVVSDVKLVRMSCRENGWQKHWDEQPRMLVGNHDHIFARVGNRLYIAGGKTYSGWPAGKWLNLSHIYGYDMRKGTWHVAAPMLEAGKSYSGIAALGGEVWLLGGYFRIDKAPGITATKTVEIFNPQTGKVRRGPDLQEPRGQVVALTAGGRLYAIGGSSDQASSGDMVSIAVGENKWRAEPSAPGPVTQASGCALNGKLYVAAPSGSKCRGLFVYDIATRKWSNVARPKSTAPQAPLCTAHKGEVWILGGLRQGGQTSSSIYSPQTGKWRAGPQIPLPVSWGAAASVNGRLLISGGAYREPRVKDYFNSDRVFLLRE